MIRPRLVLATFALSTLGTAAGADAAEFLGVLLAQSPGIQRGPGMYLNLLKFLPVLAVFLLWVWTSDWIDDDAKELNNPRFEAWNSAVFFSAILGFALLWAIPMFPIGLTLLLISYFVPLFI
jgi:hypothetical protein